MTKLKTVKVVNEKAKNGYSIINECDLTDDRVLYVESSEETTEEAKPKRTRKTTKKAVEEV